MPFVALVLSACSQGTLVSTSTGGAASVGGAASTGNPTSSSVGATGTTTTTITVTNAATGSTAIAGPGASTGSGAACGCWMGDGAYCSAVVEQRIEQTGCTTNQDPKAHPFDLFNCAGGSWSVQPCTNGCTVNSAGPDFCTSSTPACGCYSGNGAYCGNAAGNYANGHNCTIPGLASNPNALFDCTNGTWSVKQQCPSGCTFNPSGADFCTPQPTNATNNLWIAWDPSTTNCKDHTTNFYNCILGNTNFNNLAKAFSAGESVKVAGTAVVSCGATDFQCVVNQGHFTPKPWDIVMHYYGTGWAGGTNGTRNVTVNGASVPINVAWVETGNNCDGQTCTGAHELYEAATDGISADCCNGQVHSASCSQCNSSCGQYNGNSAPVPWGCYPLTCGGVTYKMELLSPPNNQYDASGCTKVQ